MKIGIDVSQVIYGTGVSSYTKNLCQNLLKIDDKNEYILFGSALRGYPKLKDFAREFGHYPNVSFKFVPIPNIILEFLQNRLRLLPIEKFIGNVDIFHSSDWTQPKVKSDTTKKITTVHDMVPFLFEKSVHPKIVSAYKRRLNLVKKEVDLILADSEATKEDLVKFMQIPQDKVKVVYLAPGKNFKNESEEKVKEVMDTYKIKKPYLLSVATQEPRKNIQKLLDAFEQIQKRIPELQLVLTGKYGWGPGLRSAENVVWTGYVPDDDLVALYSGCRVFVYPSLYEGFGLPVLEAMACGAPVVTSNNSSMAEIAKNAAILIDPRSHTQLTRAIEMILDLNLENYQKMAQASLNRAREYTWEKTARETLNAYNQLYDQIPKIKAAESFVEDLDLNTPEPEEATTMSLPLEDAAKPEETIVPAIDDKAVKTKSADDMIEEDEKVPSTRDS